MPKRHCPSLLARILGPVLALLLAHVALATEGTGLLEVHFIDVGQGDALFVRSPSGRTVLIDAGNTRAGDVVDRYLDTLGVGSLDLAVISHPHLDHMGGLLHVLRRHRPAAYMDPGFAHPLPNYDELLDWLEAEAIPVRLARGGRSITLEPGIVLQLLGPEEPLLAGTRSDANANSVVARLVYGSFSFLLTGDSEADTETRLLGAGTTLASTVLKIAHHGSRHSTTEAFLARVAPGVAVISAGQVNSYRHPSEATIQRLEAHGVEIRRTDREGTIIARTDGKTLSWETTGIAADGLDRPEGTRSFGGPPKAKKAPKSEHPPGPPHVMTSAPSAALIDINTAAADALTRLPAIGPALAGRIVEDREANGPFADLDALMRIRGIGKATVDKIRPHAVAGARANDERLSERAPSLDPPSASPNPNQPSAQPDRPAP